MILSRSEFGVQSEGPLEMAEGFVAAVQDSKKETNLVLNSGGIGVKRGGLLPGFQCPGRIAAGACCGRLGLQFAE